MLGVVETRTKHGHSAKENAPAFSGRALSDCICKKIMVRPERFELPAFWFVAVAARRISSLAVFVRSEIRQHLCGFLTPLPFQIQG